MAVPDLRRAGQGGATNITSHFAIIADAAAISMPIFISHRRASHDAAAGHGELTAFSDKHAAAKSNIPLSFAAHDAAAGHSEPAAAIHIHTAAVAIVVPVCKARAAGDDSAPDDLCAVLLIQYPQAVGIGDKFMFHIGAAVGQGKGAVAFEAEDAARGFRRLGIAQDVAVQIYRDRTRDPQRAGDGHVLRQRIHAAAQTVGDIGVDVVRFQFCSGGSGKRPR